MRAPIAVLCLLAAFAGCASPAGESRPSGERVRVALPPDRAAACFARNAEEHSGALIAEVRPGGHRAEVIVRVKNGVLYGTAEFERAGAGSTATLRLNVTTTGRRSDLVAALLEGC